MELSKMFGFAGVAATGLAVLFTCLALALPNWQGTKIDSDSQNMRIDYGLWKACVTVNDVTACKGFDEMGAGDKVPGEKFYPVVKAMLFLGLFFLAGGTAVGILKMFVVKVKKVGVAASALAFFAGLSLVAGFAIYVAEMKIDLPNTSFGAAFALDIVASCMSCAAGVLFLMEAFRSNE